MKRSAFALGLAGATLAPRRARAQTARATLAIAGGSLQYRAQAPDGGLILGTHSTVHGARDLTDKVLAVASLNDLNAIATQEWIDQHGGDARTVKFIELPPSAVGGALDQGRIEGATLWNPVMAGTIAAGRARFGAPVFDAIGKRYQVAAWFADGAWVDKNRAVAQRFAEVMHEANAYVAAHESETTELIAVFIGVDAQALGRMARSLPAAYLDPHEIEPVIAAALKYKSIAKAFPAAEMISPVALRSNFN